MKHFTYIMYGRKQSAAGIDPGALNLMQAGGAGGVGGPLGLDYGLDETKDGEGSDVIWSSRPWPRKFLRFLSLMRYISSISLIDKILLSYIVI